MSGKSLEGIIQSIYDSTNNALRINISTLISSGSILLKPSGDTDDYFTFSTVADIPTITATGRHNYRLQATSVLT
jgi:hypothetical protein